ncbi:hypothetical protein FQR65_LT11336 [Abscondita terminalis]|nr:hypothetical protein FQR65_LT11336 [Abscondita terminalis]
MKRLVSFESNEMNVNFKKTFFVILCLSVTIVCVYLLLFDVYQVLPTRKPVLLVDNEKKLDIDEQYRHAAKSMPTFPLEFWRKNTDLEFNKTCAKFPSLFDVQFQNLYWQNLRSQYGHYQIFGAYLDDRVANPLGPTVRILAMVDQIEPITTVHCQLWFSEQTQPVLVKSLKYEYAWRDGWGNHVQGIYQPYLIPCPLPQSHHNLKVVAVSLVESPCDTASNALTVFHNKPSGKKQNFAVCVKGMDFILEDVSSVLTEWIEMMLLLGADKVFMYEYHVHPNMTKVFKYYEKLGRVEVTPLTLPADRPNTLFWQHIYLENRIANKYQDEIIPYNDCFYKHMYEYKYIVVVDVDEVIVPMKRFTWTELLEDLEQNGKSYDSYNAINLLYYTDLGFTHEWFKDIPEYMHILNHVYRMPVIPKHDTQIKSFHNTETVLSVHNHYPFACLHGDCNNFNINPDDARMQHYARKNQKMYDDFTKTSVFDATIWKYKEILTKRVTKALTEMGFLV